jgi:hypothetical protein
MDGPHIRYVRVLDDEDLHFVFGIEATPGEYAVVLMTSAHGKWSMVLDLDWLLLARDLQRFDHEIVEGLLVPPSAIRWVRRGWPRELIRVDGDDESFEI